MSIDQYSRHNDDVESGLVPPQNNQPADWPKKIRSLSTDDLDRLTIDSAGRFYWDGQLVNYGFAKPDGQLIDSRELSSLASPHKETTSGDTAMADNHSSKTTDATLDAIAEALAAATPVKTEASTETAASPVAPPVVSASPYVSAAALAPAEPVSPAPTPAATVPVATASIATVLPALASAPPRDTIAMGVPVTQGPRRFRLSFFQSVGALLLVLSFLLGAVGLAASGLTVAHEYGCRAGLVTAYCPKPPPAPARPPRGIID